MGLISGSKAWTVTLVGEVTPEMDQMFGSIKGKARDQVIAQWVQEQVSVSMLLAGTLRVGGAVVQEMDVQELIRQQQGMGQ